MSNTKLRNQNRKNPKKANDTGPGHGRDTWDMLDKTFADDPDKYWERMRQVVTEPLAKVLEKQSDVFSELSKEIIRMDERTKRV